jgi:hypothetical protein
MEKDTLVISAFPGTGKTYLYDKFKNENSITILDANYMDFTWKDVDKRTSNSLFPANYVRYIKDNLGKYDIIFTSTHRYVRDSLFDANIDFLTVYPSFELKDEYIERYILRDDNELFIDFMKMKFYDFVDELDNDIKIVKRYKICKPNFYLEDVMKTSALF